LRVLNVVGARPNFVKIAPLLAEMRQREGLEPLLAHTGQHYDREMSEDFLSDLGIAPPDFRLSLGGSDAGTRRMKMRRALAAIMREANPDVVLVVGDVDSSAAAALAAHDLGILVAHVEAGLRSFDLSMPEEANRILIDSLSSLFFASEPSAVVNLLAEGYPGHRIFLTGNVMIDSLRRFEAAARESTILTRLGLREANGSPKKYVLATLHRPATVDGSAVLRRVWTALAEIAHSTAVIFPAHPRTRIRLREEGLITANGESDGAGFSLRVISPQPYVDFLRLESNAALVLTDSGGVQEETTALGVPCLTLRSNTERPITITQGTNQLIGLDSPRIIEAARRLLSGGFVRRRPPKLWDGRAAARIVRVLRREFGSRARLPQGVNPLTAYPPKLHLPVTSPA
jgi:UDP-N-acetylglucosamine 2-epimerase (non-hydrolysing)